MTQKPSVTIGIPVLNEESCIENIIYRFLQTEYTNLVEILVADGGSTDRTRDIIQRLSSEDSRVKLVENPDRYQSYALNKMIELAEGEIFLRADGHGIYAEDYVEQCVETLLETGARNVGGAQRYHAKNRVQAGISLAMKSFFGNGNAKYKKEDFDGYADTVFLGCFWTKDLKAIGGFNTENITSQDLELNLRLKEKYGECVYVSSDIKCFYFPRKTFNSLFRQYFKHARGRLVTIWLHKNRDEFRGFFPFIFLISLFGYLTFDLVSDKDLFSLYITIGLLGILVFEALRVAVLHKDYFDKKIWAGDTDPPGILSNFIYLSFTIIAMHFGHFFGFFYQLVRNMVFRVKGW